MTAYLRSKGHLLIPALKEIRQTRTEHLLQWHTKSRQENILFKDEKTFTIEEQYNRQNNKIYVQTSHEAKEKVPRVQRGHHPSYVMVWWGVSNQEVTALHFCNRGVKTGARMYQEDVLQGVVKPLNTTLFNGQKWVFQQDSAPAHKAKMTREWLWRHIPAFISAEDWPPRSPDLNPLDYKTVGCFGGHGLPKASQQPGQSEEIPRESSGRDSPGDGAYRDSSVAGASQGLHRDRGQPF